MREHHTKDRQAIRNDKGKPHQRQLNSDLQAQPMNKGEPHLRDVARNQRSCNCKLASFPGFPHPLFRTASDGKPGNWVGPGNEANSKCSYTTDPCTLMLLLTKFSDFIMIRVIIAKISTFIPIMIC